MPIYEANKRSALVFDTVAYLLRLSLNLDHPRGVLDRSIEQNLASLIQNYYLNQTHLFLHPIYS